MSSVVFILSRRITQPCVVDEAANNIHVAPWKQEGKNEIEDGSEWF